MHNLCIAECRPLACLPNTQPMANAQPKACMSNLWQVCLTYGKYAKTMVGMPNLMLVCQKICLYAQLMHSMLHLWLVWLMYDLYDQPMAYCKSNQKFKWTSLWLMPNLYENICITMRCGSVRNCFKILYKL